MNRYLTHLVRCLVGDALVATVGAPSLVSAQDVSTGQATAQVLAILQVAAVQALDFGNVYQGVPKVQDETSDALSGIFSISGAPSANIACYFTFSATDATFSVLDAAAPSTPSAPGAGATLNANPRNLTGTAIGAGGAAQIFLGGEVIPTVNQTAGAYSADIVLTVSYTGS